MAADRVGLAAEGSFVPSVAAFGEERRSSELVVGWRGSGARAVEMEGCTGLIKRFDK